MKQFSSYAEIKSLFSKEYEQVNLLTEKSLLPLSMQNCELSNSLSVYFNSTSKQLRSCLVFLYSKIIFGNIDENIIKLATVVELIHNATLIHDDIIDDADIRRGKVALHKQYGNKLAILSGDYLLSSAIQLLSEIQNIKVIECFSDALLKLCKGEVSQYFSEKKTPTINAYIQKSDSKTASLFIAALKSLSLLGKNLYLHEIEQFATAFGIAFQIKDDLNNFIDEKGQKPLLIDIEDGVYTAPVIMAFGENKDLSKFSAEEIYKKAIVQDNIATTKNLLIQKTNEAKNAIMQIPDSLCKQSIITICNFLCK